MTLNQLKVFVLVVRLGSFRAAADALGVSEPAVSQAIAALRASLGDPLVGRNGGVAELTPAGQRIVGLASQMVNLAAEVEAAVRQASGGPSLLRVVAAATAAETTVPSLLQSFAERVTSVEATLGVATTDEMRALLTERLADVAIGPALVGSDAPGVVSDALLRYRLVLVTGTRHRLACRGPFRLRQLAGADWFVDPTGTDPTSDVGRLLDEAGVPAARVSVFPTQRQAWAAAAAAEGVAPAVEHLLAREAPSGIVPLRVDGMPIETLWYVNTLTGDRRSPIVRRLHHFLSSADATHAMIRGDGRVPAHRFRPPVYVTIWS